MWKFTLSTLIAGLMLAVLGMGRLSAAEAIPAGQKIFTNFKCSQCHSIDSLKIAKVKSDEADDESEEGDEKDEPSDLSDAGKRHDAAFISKWLMKEEKIKGKKHKKKFKGNAEELKTLSDWLGTIKYNVPKKKS